MTYHIKPLGTLNPALKPSLSAVMTSKSIYQKAPLTQGPYLPSLKQHAASSKSSSKSPWTLTTAMFSSNYTVKLQCL
jgi:hypothetical protein